MNMTTQQSSRPVAVNLALFILLVSFAVSLIPQLVRADWTSFLVYIQLGSELVILAVPLWFISRGKNWARWLLVVFAVAGFCDRLPQLIRQFQEHSVWWVVNYRLLSLIEAVALVALFHPSTSEWFLRDWRKRRERQRRQDEVEAQVRKEYEQRLSEMSDYWQKADIEAEVSKLVKERMKLIHDARAV
jgi:hypothetical protein